MRSYFRLPIPMIELSFESPATLDSLQADAFTLATITFYTTDYGTSALDFGTVVLGDANGDPLSFTTVNDSVTVSAIPVPAAVWMFASGLAALMGWRRKTMA